MKKVRGRGGKWFGIPKAGKFIHEKMRKRNPYNGWTNWDTWNVNLIMDNEEPLYRYKVAWQNNFLKKWKAGKFDLEKAAKAVRLYVVPAAIKQDKMYGGGHSEIDRKAVNAHEIAQHWLDDAILEDFADPSDNPYRSTVTPTGHVLRFKVPETYKRGGAALTSVLHQMSESKKLKLKLNPFRDERSGKTFDGEIVVFPPETESVGVLVNARTGKATNRWGDGTVGVPEDIKIMAEEETDGINPRTRVWYSWSHKNPNQGKQYSKNPLTHCPSCHTYIHVPTGKKHVVCPECEVHLRLIKV